MFSLIAPRSLARLQRNNMVNATQRMFSSAEYESLNGENGVYTPNNRVAFKSDNSKFTVFDGANTNETRYMPWEVKEHAFKHGMGFMGTCVLNHLWCLGPWASVACMAFVGNWAFRTSQILFRSVNKVELHDCGKNITLHTNLGQSVQAKITDVKKERHEKTLVSTYEEAYLFPITVAGKPYFLHGCGHESIKHGEAFRAIINGQQLKL